MWRAKRDQPRPNEISPDQTPRCGGPGHRTQATGPRPQEMCLSQDAPTARVRVLDLRHPAVALGTWFGSGLIPGPAGTWGTIAGLPLGMALLWMGGPWTLNLAAMALFLLGLWSAAWLERRLGLHDPSQIVVDEVVGIWVALLAIAPGGTVSPMTAVWALVAFGLFRLFDAWKPGPVGWVDRRVPGAMGVMLDDVVAGLGAGAGVLVLRALTGV